MRPLALLLCSTLLSTAAVFSSTAPPSHAASPVPYIGCKYKGHGRFADTCHDIYLHSDNKTLSATCATDGSMTRFKVNDDFNLDRRVVDFNGQLQVVYSCTNRKFPLFRASCEFSRYCENIQLIVLSHDSNEINTTTGIADPKILLTADCSDREGNWWTNQVDLNPYITNRKGKLQWACRW